MSSDDEALAYFMALIDAECRPMRACLIRWVLDTQELHII